MYKEKITVAASHTSRTLPSSAWITTARATTAAAVVTAHAAACTAAATRSTYYIIKFTHAHALSHTGKN